MASEQAKDLRLRGITAAKAGDKDTARQLLQQSIRLEPDSEAAWLWLASVSRDSRERVFCLEKLLDINPNNETALKALSSLQGDSAPPPAPAIRTLGGMSVPPPQTTQEVASQTPGIPIPSAERIAEAQRQVDAVVREYLAPADATNGVKWVHKTRRRAGERDALYLRMQVGVAVLTFLVILGVGGVYFALNNADARAILFAPTHTPTFTPTVTPTNTPGLTPTPSPTPNVSPMPSATPPEIFPTFDPYFPPRATAVYPRVESLQLQNAVALVESGRYNDALPTLAVEREAVRELFNPAPYYFEALAQAASGNPERALRTLEEAEGNLTAATTNQFKPVLDAGYTVVYRRLAEDAFAAGQDAAARDYIDLLRERAESAIDGDPRNPAPYLALARSYSLSGDDLQALQVIDDALSVSDLQTNALLIVERGQLYFRQEEYDQAMYEAFLALYMNPGTEQAHQLRIRAALAQNAPGDAVIYAQNYLYYFPGSVVAWKLLGDARVMEGNSELAIAAYTQALADEDQNVGATVDALVARGDLYFAQGRYDLARQDFTSAFELSDDPAIQARRMDAAYRAGNSAVALGDADDLVGQGVISDSELNLLRARILLDDAEPGDEAAFQQAVGYLALLGDLPPEQVPFATEVLARAHYGLGNHTAALAAVDAAMTAGETGSRHYLRGLILEAQGEDDEAAREYQWVLTWSQIYPYDFRFDAEERLAGLTGDR